jgi:peptide/nickel transport system substrate-binding protein
LLRRAAGGAVVLSAGGLLAACGSSASSSSSTSAGTSAATGAAKAGGHLRIGATGGGAKDSIDAHSATADTDIVRISALFEPLAQPSADFKSIEMVLAESIAPVNGNAGVWDIRLRQGVEFHNGKPLTADDVIFSLKRITDPKNPLTGFASISYINRNGMKKMDAHTVRVPLTTKNAAFLADVGQYFNGIVPVGYDPKNPVSTGPWKFQSFTPASRACS